MRAKRLRVVCATWLFSLALLACHHTAKTQVVPPAPAVRPQAAPAPNLVVLLPEPDGKPGGLSVTNQGGTQNLTQPYQAIRIENANTAPSAPFTMDQAEVRRVFGTIVDALPAPEVSFLLYFAEASETLTPESSAQIPAILNMIRDRHSTAISVIGHTDTTGNPQANYQLGLRRAQTVSAIIRQQGTAADSIFVESHGDADLLVKTARGVAEARNRRVEVIIR
jgi:peptidoglycan-associated lipoprotein